jgi:hypothetical protein
MSLCDAMTVATRRFVLTSSAFPAGVSFTQWKPLLSGGLSANLIWRAVVNYPSGSVRSVFFYINIYMSPEDIEAVLTSQSRAFECIKSKLWSGERSVERIRRFYNKGVLLMDSGKRRWVGVGAVKEIPFDSNLVEYKA